MHDPSGKLTPEEAERARTWLLERWGGGRQCPWHPTVPNNWEMGDVIMTLPFTGGGVSIGGPTYPLLTVSCSHCAYTVLFNAIKMGVVPRQEAPVAETPPEAAPAPVASPVEPVNPTE